MKRVSTAAKRKPPRSPTKIGAGMEGEKRRIPSNPVTSNQMVPAVSRAIAILRLLARSEDPLTLKQISTELDIVPSSCLHILRVLVSEALVSLEPGSKRYQIGIGVLSFASKAMGQDRLLGYLQQETDSISRKFNLTAFASKIDGGRSFVVAVSIPRTGFSVQTHVGNRYPVYMGATGICLAAFSDSDPKAIFQSLKDGIWARLPKQSEWLAEVRRCKANGYAVDRENYAAGMTLITAPILTRDGMVTHAITAAIIGQTKGKNSIDDVGRELVASAKKLHVFSQ